MKMLRHKISMLAALMTLGPAALNATAEGQSTEATFVFTAVIPTAKVVDNDSMVTVGESVLGAADGEFTLTVGAAAMLQVLSAGASQCPGDLDGNGEIGVEDLLTTLAAWGTDPGGPPDLNGDGEVNIFDLLIILSSWGPC